MSEVQQRIDGFKTHLLALGVAGFATYLFFTNQITFDQWMQYVMTSGFASTFRSALEKVIKK